MDFLKSVLLGTRALLITAFAAGGGAVYGQTGRDQEEVDWQRALAEGTSAAFQRYLEYYPTGRYASEAFACTIEADMCSPAGFDPSISRGVGSDLY
jgi:hypothetical protein